MNLITTYYKKIYCKGDNLKICKKCGEEISDNLTKVCPKCGGEIEETNDTNSKEKSIETKKDNINKLVDGANNTLNKVVNQAKIEKNYIKSRIEDNNQTQVKGNDFIISEKIANTIDNITKEQKKDDKTQIKVDDEK